MNKQSNIAVLGGFGFLGGHLVDRLVASGHAVTVFGRPTSMIKETQWPVSVRRVYGDFANTNDVRDALTGMKVAFHLVSTTVPQSSNENPRYDIEANVIPTISFLELCIELGLEQVVFASSGGTVYGMPQRLPIDECHPTYPICSYGVHKLVIEHYMRILHRLSGIHMTVLRISNPYGPRQNVKRGQGIIGTFCRRIVEGRPIEVWGDGSVVRDYIYISDVITAMAEVIGRTKGYQVYNIGSGVGTSINELVACLRVVTSLPIEEKHLISRPVDVPINVLDASRFREEFGWHPKMDIKRGLAETMAWHMTQ